MVLPYAGQSALNNIRRQRWRTSRSVVALLQSAICCGACFRGFSESQKFTPGYFLRRRWRQKKLGDQRLLNGVGYYRTVRQ